MMPGGSSLQTKGGGPDVSVRDGGFDNSNALSSKEKVEIHSPLHQKRGAKIILNAKHHPLPYSHTRS
jgi:hypothetical protein